MMPTWVFVVGGIVVLIAVVGGIATQRAREDSLDAQIEWIENVLQEYRTVAYEQGEEQAKQEFDQQFRDGQYMPFWELWDTDKEEIKQLGFVNWLKKREARLWDIKIKQEESREDS